VDRALTRVDRALTRVDKVGWTGRVDKGQGGFVATSDGPYVAHKVKARAHPLAREPVWGRTKFSLSTSGRFCSLLRACYGLHDCYSDYV
jgi:hypothetical protein